MRPKLVFESCYSGLIVYVVCSIGIQEAHAQNPLIISPPPLSLIAVETATERSFTRVSTPSQVEWAALLKDVIPFSLSVTNHSEFPVSAVSAEFAVEYQNGLPYRHFVTVSSRYLDRPLDMIAPGETYFLSPDPALNAAVRGGRASGAVAALEKFRARLERFQAGKAVRASLDLIVFSDGSFVGLDQRGTAERLRKTWLAERDLFAALAKARTESEAKAALDARVATIDGTTDDYKAQAARLVNSLSPRLAAIGFAQFVEDMQRMAARPAVPHLFRR